MTIHTSRSAGRQACNARHRSRNVTTLETEDQSLHGRKLIADASSGTRGGSELPGGQGEKGCTVLRSS